MVNDAKHGNCVMKKILVGGEEHLCLFATVKIHPGDQLFYNYGDDPARLFWRNKASFIYNYCQVEKFVFNSVSDSFTQTCFKYATSEYEY